MEYTSVSEFYKKLFGQKVYKIAIDAGCTCPTRDGTLGTKGCIFCSANGSGDFVPQRNKSIKEQIEEAKRLVAKKSGSLYIAYFQNFTNTYGDPEQLEKKYREALNQKDIAGIDIATRPDCITDQMLEKLAALSKETFVTVELGLQTSCEKSAEYIRRGYRNEVYMETMQRLKQKAPKIHTVTQLIFGLPEETEEDMLNSVKFALDAGTDGFKFTVLYVLKGTDLEKEFAAGKFRCLSQAEYFALLKKALAVIPKDKIIHRLTGDGPKSLLIEPQWTANKRNVMNSLKKYLSE